MYTRKELPYDENDAKSIFQYAKKLVGHNLREMTSAPLVLKDASARKVKGKFGQYLEKYYFFLKRRGLGGRSIWKD